MSNGKHHEQLLTQNYEKLIMEMNSESIKYNYFDIHHECKGHVYEKLK